MSSVRQEDVDDGDEQRQGKARMGVKRADSGQRLIQCSSCFKKVYISVKYNTHFKCPPNNIHQGESEGKNLYQCKECGNSMCLVCSVVDVTISHFYGMGGHPTDSRPCPMYGSLPKSAVGAGVSNRPELLRKVAVTQQGDVQVAMQLSFKIFGSISYIQ